MTLWLLSFVCVIGTIGSCVLVIVLWRAACDVFGETLNGIAESIR